MLGNLRIAVKVRTTHVGRVLNGLTHPTELGASKLMFANRTANKVTPETLLLLDILREEAQADIRVPSVDLSDFIRRPTVPPPFMGQTVRMSLVSGEDPPLDYIPPPPPSVVCEFDLGLNETVHPVHGKRAMAIFGFLVFQVEGKVTMPLEGAYDGQETGSAAETSGVWRAANRRERNAETERVHRPTKRVAANY